ncbi:MAG TPA: TIR domain-containing protein [Blastocatellia bacterium]|nr:TIR domain-containing protein [Blastocatellia bacterium]
MSTGTVITFYSYKGGVGRTLALANIGALLCRWGYKVLCIDWDLEAPGLDLYFNPWVTTPDRPGLTELIHEHIDGGQPEWQDYLTQVNFPATTEASPSLLLMKAGMQDETYVRRMQALDWTKLYKKHDLGNFLEDLRNQWRKEFDFILVDSRTGITDIGGICTVQLPDLLVLLFTANLQSLRGSLDVMERARNTRNSLPFDRSRLLALPVPTRFESRIEYEEAERWLKIFADELAPLYAEWAGKEVTATDLLNYARVPYVAFWSFGEKLPVIEKGTSNPDDIGFYFETLAALVAQRFSNTEMLVKNRDSFVRAARKVSAISEVTDQSAAKSGASVRLYISYSHKDEMFLDELNTHLKLLQRMGLIKIWSDRRIEMGESWKEQLDQQLEQAQIILLLVSADYLASDFAHDVEMKYALEKHYSGEAVAIPVLLRPTAWQESPLASIQALPPNGRPISTWENRDEAWVEVVKGIREAIARFENSQQSA